MGLVTPIVEYNSITIDGQDILLSSSCRASFKSPYNKIEIKMTPTASSLSYYEVRVTSAAEDYDIGVGQLAYWDSNISAAVEKKFTIDITPTIFTHGDGTYRISLYAKSAIDGSWDVSYLFFTVDNLPFILADGKTFSVLTTREAPLDHN
jgi:hypothetical protein